MAVQLQPDGSNRQLQLVHEDNGNWEGERSLLSFASARVRARCRSICARKLVLNNVDTVSRGSEAPLLSSNWRGQGSLLLCIVGGSVLLLITWGRKVPTLFHVF